MIRHAGGCYESSDGFLFASGQTIYGYCVNSKHDQPKVVSRALGNTPVCEPARKSFPFVVVHLAVSRLSHSQSLVP